MTPSQHISPPARPPASAGPAPARRLSLLRRLRCLWRELRALLGRHAPTPVRQGWFGADEVAAYHQAVSTRMASVIDDATWNDLELGRYLDALSLRSSIFGRQMLLHRLRVACHVQPAETCAARLRGAEPSQVAQLDAAVQALQPLGCIDNKVASLLFGLPPALAPAWLRHTRLLPLAFAAALALLVSGSLLPGLLVLALALGISARVQILLYAPMTAWNRQRDALLAMAEAVHAVHGLHAVRTVPDVPDMAAQAGSATTPHPLLQETLGLHDAARTATREFGPRWSDRVPGIAEYANLLALQQYRRYGSQLAVLRASRMTLQQVFVAIAGLEADLAVHAHLQCAQGTCAAEPVAGRALVFSGLRHPLLSPAHPIDLALQGQGAFISGQNGTGKSTLLRSVGLNVVIGQALGFCHAAAAHVPARPVISSLQVEDVPAEATSLYMAELDRARALSAAAAAPGGALCLVDEIFRGTNAQDSVAATAALAHELAGTALLLLASHHRVLARLLAADLQPWCVERDADGVQQLRAGVLAQTNGVAMLADYGFSPRTQAVAAQVLEWLHNRADKDTEADDIPTLVRPATGGSTDP